MELTKEQTEALENVKRLGFNPIGINTFCGINFVFDSEEESERFMKEDIGRASWHKDEKVIIDEFDPDGDIIWLKK